MPVLAHSPHPSRIRRVAATAARGLGTLVFTAALAVLVATYVPSLLGYERYVLVGRSMEPTIHRGSLVFDEVVPVAALRRGDVITYVPPGMAKPRTHRILSVQRRDGQLLFRTKGDNNQVADPGPFVFEQPRQARVKFAIPAVGWVYVLLTLPGLRLWLAIVPAGLLIAWAIASLWRDGGAILRERAAGELP
jgi:signal peptidase